MKISSKITGVRVVKEDESPITTPAERPFVMSSKTYKIKPPESVHKHALYITISDDENGNPFEIFINSKNIESHAWIAALTRLMSAVFRRSNGNIDFVVDELHAVFDPRGGFWHETKHRPSILALVGDVIQTHMRGTQETQETQETNPEDMQWCSSCQSFGVVVQGGCKSCANCGDGNCA